MELDNSTGETLTVSSVETTGPDAVDFPNNNACNVVEDGNSCDVNVSFDPATVGAKEAQLEIVDDNGTVVVPLTGSGVTGTLSGFSPTFEPQPYFFGDQERSANISNPSSSAAAATVATITGPDVAFFSVGFNGCQFVIPPAAACSVGVDFNPSGPGTKNAQLELSNDGTVDPLVIPLTATALAGPHAVISPAPGELRGRRHRLRVGSMGFHDQKRRRLPTADPATASPLGNAARPSRSRPTFAARISIAPAASCQFTVSFQPSGNGEREGTVFVTTKENGPVYTASLVGNGIPSPNGTATVTGAAAAGSQLTSVRDGYPDGTRFAYQWRPNRRGDPGCDRCAAHPRQTPMSAAASPVACGRRTRSARRPSLRPRAPRSRPKSLSGLDGSLVGPSVCRIGAVPRAAEARREDREAQLREAHHPGARPSASTRRA